jgi:hypothetical protein
MQGRKFQLKTNICANFQQNTHYQYSRGMLGFDGKTHCCSIHWDSVWTYNNLRLKELEILRKIMYYLKCDKTGLTPFCFSDREIINIQILFAQCKYTYLLVQRTGRLLYQMNYPKTYINLHFTPHT